MSVGQVTQNSVQLHWTFTNAEFTEQLRKAIELEQSIEGLTEEGVEQIINPQLQSNQTNLLVPRPTNTELKQQQTSAKPNRESLVSGYYLHYKR